MPSIASASASASTSSSRTNRAARMVRPVAQVVDSQWAMLARQGQNPKSEKQHLVEVPEHHSRQICTALAASDRVTLLEVSPA